MKAYQVNRYRKNEKMHLSEIAKPVINDNEVLVEIHAASVNLIDAKIRNGEFKMIMPYKPPFTIGHDVAGVVTQKGAKVSKFKIGDEVFASCKGTFAEFITVNENDLALKPKNITMQEAASIPLVGLTAWQVLVEKGNLKKGQKVFIQAGSGGVGTIAIQLAKHLGAYVATTTSSANNDLVKSLGADLIIDYKTQDFETILKDYDLVLNSQDSKTLEKSMKVLKPAGKAISISGPPDVDYANEAGLNWLLKNVIRLLSFKIKKIAKRLQVHYSFLFMKPNGKQLSEITALIEAGIIRPVIDKVFPFAETNEAMSYVEAGRAKGKVVVRVK
ncbi:MAG TPA: NADP-dependent oxidoreductase [Ferruginibacter sp.]|nr:NADP-dependent oxidoreductase [Ferruginibacter sp.]